jgi:chemotaxis protein CheD
VLAQMTDVGKRNIDFAVHYLQTENIKIETTDTGDLYPRKVIFEPLSGRAFIKKLYILQNDTIAQREKDYVKHIDRSKIDGDVELF